METAFAYAGSSGVAEENGADVLRLAPNLKRDPVQLRARVTCPLIFRDALLALNDVIRSQLYSTPEEIMDRQRDPLITVTPDGVFFEVLSTDESSYARMTLRPAALEGLSDTAYGCTNIAFSDSLLLSLRDIRSARPTHLEVARSGFTVQQPQQTIKEEKIPLPDGWMRGFLEVQAALRLSTETLTLHPIDIGNVLNYLRGRKEQVSPRALVFKLEPGKSPTVTVQPWDKVFTLRQSKFEGRGPAEVKVWGRRRLLLLEKILPHTQSIRACLLGSGMPSFWICDLGAVSFMLGMSAWSSRDWTESDCFRLLEPPVQAAPEERERVLALLEEFLKLSAEDVARRAGLERGTAEAALNHWCLEGRALYDADSGNWYARRVFTENPPPPPGSTEREKEAEALVEKGKVEQLAEEPAQSTPGLRRFTAVVKGKGGRYGVVCDIAADQRLHSGRCQCPFYAKLSLFRGPCKHLLAVHRAATRKTEGKASR